MNKILDRTLKFTLVLIYTIPFFYFILMFTVVGEGVKTKDPFFVTLAIFTIVSIPFQMLFYISNVFINKKVDNDKKVLWAVLLFLGNILVYPVYWYLYIWRKTKKTKELQGSEIIKSQ